MREELREGGREGRVWLCLPVDALSARAVGVGEVAALSHEAGDDAMEDGAFVMQLLACANQVMGSSWWINE